MCKYDCGLLFIKYYTFKKIYTILSFSKLFSTAQLFTMSFSDKIPRLKSLPEWVGIPLPKSRDNVVPGAPDVYVITKILDHFSLFAQDVLDLEPRVPWINKTMKTCVLTPFKICHRPVKGEGKGINPLSNKRAITDQIYLQTKYSYIFTACVTDDDIHFY